MIDIAHQRLDRAAILVGPLVVLALIAVFAGWTGNESNAALDAFRILLQSGAVALAWLGAAVGLGWPLRLILIAKSDDALPLQAALGIAALMVIDEVLGCLGILQFGGSAGAWILTACGLALLTIQFMRWRATRPPPNAPPWLEWTVSPAIAVLLLAACAAPGWLWTSEFGGYDALSYHLQLPKEWLALGSIQPLVHNVYSWLPGYVEAAYYHIAGLTGDGIKSVYACQLLHASMALLAATTVGSIAGKLLGSSPGLNRPTAFAAGSVILLGTPWVIVVGSLGYNEMAVELMLAAGLLVILDRSMAAWRRGVVVGILCGAACGAKLTAVGMVVVPLGLALMAETPPRKWPLTAFCATLAGLLCLSPYLVRNYATVGNPVFPFASSVFGQGHWTPEQHEVFAGGHISDSNLPNRLAEFWNQFMRYGIGPNPYADEPWKPQWSILPWLGVAGLAMGMSSSRCRRWSVIVSVMLGVQIVFWMCFTHLKSRFLLPAAVPLTLGVVIGFASAADWLNDRQRRPGSQNRRDPIRTGLMCIGLILWTLWPVMIFRSERDGGPAALIGGAGLLSGDDLDPEARRGQAESILPAVTVNYLLPPDVKVLLIGDAKPLYYRDKIAYQTTWDRGPLSQLMREHPDDPLSWQRGLRDRGFTHLLVDESMLLRWERAGWNDPLITRDRVLNFAQRFASVQARFAGDETLYRLAE